MRNAKHFERLHKRASTMKNINAKAFKGNLTSHLEHNEHGLDAKKVFCVYIL